MPQILINPRGVFRRDENPIAPRPDSLERKVLGLIDNSKDNAGLFLDGIERRIRQSCNIREVVRIGKAVSGTPAPFTDDFFSRCDAVVNAFGD